MPVVVADLAQLRTRPMMQTFHLAVEIPNVIATGVVQGAHAWDTNDIVIAAPGMTVAVRRHFTVLFGTVAGGRDIGVSRMRYDEAAACVLLRIARHEFAIAGGVFVTVIDQVRCASVLPDLDNTLEDFDRAYPGANLAAIPLPRVGPPACGFLSEGGWLDVYFTSASQAIGGALAAHAWWFTSGTPATSAVAAPGNVRYTTLGHHLVRYQVTDANGALCNTYRKVYVFDENNPPINNFTVESLMGDRDSGDWQATITIREDCDETLFTDLAQVVIFTRQYWGTDQERDDVGYGWTGRDNILFVGYIVGDTVVKDAECNTVSFDALGATAIMKSITCWGANLRAVGAADWHRIPTMTVNTAAHHVFTQHTTIPWLTDVYLDPLGAILIDYIDFDEGDPYDHIAVQIGEAGRELLLGNKQGGIYLEPNVQLRLAADRAALDTYFQMTHDDWRDNISLGMEWDGTYETCQIDFIGFSQNLDPWGSLAPACQWSTGKVEKITGVRVDNQANANLYSGMFEGYSNAHFKDVSIPMAGFWPVFDIAPQRRLDVTLAAGDTFRELVWDERRHLIKQVSFVINNEGGFALTDLVLEQESTGDAGITNTIPTADPDPPPPMPPGPIQPPGLPAHYGIILLSSTQLARSFDFFEVEDPSWVDISDGLSGTYYHMTINQIAGTQAYCTTSDGVFYCGNFLDDSPIWHVILMRAAAIAAAGYVHDLMAITLGMNGTVWTPTLTLGAWQGGYFTGAAGGLAFAAYPACNATVTRTWQGSYCAHCLTSGGIRFNARRFAPNLAIYLDNLACVDSNDYEGIATESADIFIVNYRLADGLNYVYSAPATNMGWPTCGPMGIDELAGSCLYYGNAPAGVYRDGGILATSVAVFGAAVRGGRCIFSRKPIGSTSEIVWVTAVAATTPIVVWTVDGFTNWLDKSGDFVAELGAWGGGSGSSEADGNCQVLCFEYRTESGGGGTL